MSGQHDHPIHIKRDDDILIIGRDSIIRNMKALNEWINGEDELFPLGMYVFTFIDENSLEHNHQILVYDNSERTYKELISALPAIFADFGVDEEVIESKTLNAMIAQCASTYFDYDMLHPYNYLDIEYLLKYFAQKESEPRFVPFDDGDRKKIDISLIAKEIFEKDMKRSEQNNYVNSLWDDEKSLFQVYFGNKYFFTRQLEIEIDSFL